MNSFEESFIEAVSKFLHYFSFIFSIIVIIVFGAAIYYIDKRQSEPIIKDNIISSKWFLIGYNSIGIFFILLIFLLLIFGIIKKIHEFSDYRDLSMKEIFYITIPLIILFTFVFIFSLLNVIFFISGIDKSKEENNNDIGDNIFLSPITHLSLNILILLLSFIYIGFFVFSLVLRLLRK